MLISLLIIVCVAGLLYWAVNRLPIAPTVAQVAKVVIVVVACLLALGTVTGHNFIPGL